MSPSAADKLARTVADAAAAWLRDPHDAQAYRRLVEAVDAYSDWREPPLDVQIVDTATTLLRLTDAGTAGDLLRGDDIRETMARLRHHIDQIQQPKNSTE
jgi:hypothetical protein